MAETENKEIVARMWECLYRKDWDGVARLIADDGHYEDVPAPDAGATGPQNVVRRLRIGLEPVARFEHDIHRVVAEGFFARVVEAELALRQRHRYAELLTSLRIVGARRTRLVTHGGG